MRSAQRDASRRRICFARQANVALKDHKRLISGGCCLLGIQRFKTLKLGDKLIIFR
jgi:hypothetical protein